MVEGISLAGRVRELESVCQILQGESEHGALLVVGEAGIGKSRLITAAASRAAGEGVLVLPGWCLAMSDGLPLLPISEMLHTLERAEGGTLLPLALKECPPFVRPELARLLPALGDDDSAGPRTAGSAPGLDEGWRRLRLFDALRQLFGAVADRRPVAAVVEDVHWADPSSLEYLDFVLSPASAANTIPVVVTCRSEETTSTSVAQWLQRAERNPRLVRLDLDPLTRDETAEQIDLLIASGAQTADVDQIYTRSEGNAFFTEQLVIAASHGADTGTLPAGLVALLLARIAALPDPARDLVAALAVARRPLDETELARVCDRDMDDVRGALRDLLSVWLLRRPDPEGRHQLRHALLAEAVSAELLPGRRQQLHRAVAELLVERSDATLAAEIADHLQAANQSADELRWRITAARQAEAFFAASQAARQWRRAIDLFDVAPDAALAEGMSLARLYAAAEDAFELSGAEEGAALQLAEEALERLVDVDPEDRADVLTRAGWFQLRATREEGLELLHEALAIYRDLPASAGRIETLMYIYIYYLQFGREDEVADVIDEAARLAEQLGDRAATLHIEAFHTHGRTPEEQVAYLRDLRSSLRESDGPELHVELDVGLTHDLGLLGRLSDIRDVGLPALTDAAAHGMEDSFAVAVLRLNVVDALIELGLVDIAAGLIDPLTQLAPDPATQPNYGARAHLDMLRGKLDEARTRWQQLNEEGWLVPSYEAGLAAREAELHLWQRAPAEAWQRSFGLLRQIVPAEDGAISGTGGFLLFAAALLRVAIRACADLAEQARAERDEHAVSEAQQRAADLAALHARMRPDPLQQGDYSPTARADRLQWEAENRRLEGEYDEEYWSAAAAAWDEIQRPHWAAYARWRQAEARLAAQGGRAGTDAILRTAANQAEQHEPLLASIRDLARRARIDLAETRPSAAEQVHASSAETDLTDRELAVLQLLAEGKTNSEIGAALFMSAKTASVHVTHILHKLGVATRVQAAAVAERTGLLRPTQ